MDRRTFLASLPALAWAGPGALARGAGAPRLGMANFSCHLHWDAVRKNEPGLPFTDALGYYEYARRLGADGVQSGLRSRDAAVARALRARVEETGGCYEAELSLPSADTDLADFETSVTLAREAGARVARTVLLGGRRYEAFRTAAEYEDFRARGERALKRAEPILRKHGLKLAVENHKDQTAPEFLEMLHRLSSEWIGVCVDLGNNIALLEEPHEVVRALAPFALSVHLKDMAVELCDQGFLLSDVRLGTGFLDLPDILRTLTAKNPGIIFNLEMATRDPLLVPCLTPGYWATFPDRPASELVSALSRLRLHPPRGPLPRISGRPLAEQLAAEEEDNRVCLAWARQKLGL